MDEEGLRSALHRQGLGRVAEDLLAMAAPMVRIYAKPAEDEAIPIGASKLGGQPDLPEGVERPAWHEPMGFLGQFNLAEVAPHDTEAALPTAGLLSFFFETDGEPLYSARWGLPDDAPYEDDPAFDPSPGWRVLYHQGDPATFVRREIPPDLNEFARYAPCAARFAAEITLPDVDGPEIAPLGLTTAERSALINIELEVNKGTWKERGYHLLGYPINFGGAALARCDEESRHLGYVWADADAAQRLEIERDVATRWRLLLQLDSSGDTGFDWAGGGVLHVCIECQALPRADFSRVWLIMQLL